MSAAPSISVILNAGSGYSLQLETLDLDFARCK
jgi:hypothetical protein